MKPEHKLILLSTNLHSSSEELETINNLLCEIDDWNTFSRLLLNNTCAPLIYKKVQQLPNIVSIPDETLLLLRKAYYKTISRGSLMYAEFTEIVKIFQQNMINFIALKGIYLSEWLYHDIGLRQFSDIDLLVSEKDAIKAMYLLSDAGFYQNDPLRGLSKFVDSVSNEEGLNFTHFEALTKNGISVEIHLKLSPDKDKDRYNFNISELFENASTKIVNKQHIKVLQDQDLLIHIAVHTDIHFRYGHIQFTCFTDLVNLLEKFKSEFDWENFIYRCQEFNCEKAVFSQLLLVNKYYNAYLPPYIIKKYGYLELDEIESQFINYLDGNDFVLISKTAVSGHIKNIKSIRSFTVLLRYLKEVLFPPKVFMVEKYDPQPLKGGKSKKGFPLGVRGKLWWLWYPYRWIMGLKGLWLVVTKNTLVKKNK